MKKATYTPAAVRVLCGLILAFTAVRFIYLVVKFHWTVSPGDFLGGYILALIVREGLNFYDPSSIATVMKMMHLDPTDPTMIPKLFLTHIPLYHVTKIPFTFFSFPLALLLWRLFLLATLGLTGYLFMRAIHSGWSWEWIGIICLIFLSGRPIPWALKIGNNVFLLLCLLTAVWWAHQRDRPWLTGALLGLSVMFKLVPLILIPLFLIKRHYQTVVATLTTLLGLILLNQLLVGGSATSEWLFRVKVYHDYVLHRPYQINAISLVHKLLGGARPTLAYGVGAGAMFALYAVSLFICSRRGGPLSIGEYATVVALIPVCSSYVYPIHLVLLVFPLLATAHILMESERFPGFRWGAFTIVWLAWALGFYYFRWADEASFGLKSLLGYVPLFSAIGLWGLLLSCIGTRPAESIMDKPSPSEITLRS